MLYKKEGLENLERNERLYFAKGGTWAESWTLYIEFW